MEETKDELWWMEYVGMLVLIETFESGGSYKECTLTCTLTVVFIYIQITKSVRNIMLKQY